MAAKERKSLVSDVLFAGSSKDEDKSKEKAQEKPVIPKKPAAKKAPANKQQTKAVPKVKGQGAEVEEEKPSEARESLGKEKLTDQFIRFGLNQTLYDRVLKYIGKDIARVREMSDLCRQALAEFLDREEPIVEEMEKEMEKVRARLSGK